MLDDVEDARELGDEVFADAAAGRIGRIGALLARRAQ